MPAVTDTPVPEKSRESGETKVQETKKERPEPEKKQEALWQVTIQREAGENRDKKKIVFVTPSKEAGRMRGSMAFFKGRGCKDTQTDQTVCRDLILEAEWKC